MLDLAKLLKDGKPDKTAIGKLVEQLAAVPAAPGHIPAGPRDPGNANGDLFRDIAAARVTRQAAPRRRILAPMPCGVMRRQPVRRIWALYEA